MVPSGNLKPSQLALLLLASDLHDLFSAVGEMLLDLLVRKLEYLEPVHERGLRGARVCKVINHFAVRERLLHVFVCKVNNHVAIRIGFSLNTVRENDLLLAALVNPLNLTVVAHHLVHNF